jgi:uncharacterized protein (TIGR01777 family)
MLGSALRESLRGSGAEVIQLVRRQPAHSSEMRWDGKGVQNDEKFREGLTAAIHLSGANVSAHRWTRGYRREIRESRVDSTRILAEALARMRRAPPVLMAASAVGIYGDRGDEVLTEASDPGDGFLADVCREWEAAAQPAVEAGIRVVHLRFGVVLNAGGGALGKMMPIFRLGLGGRLGSGQQWMSWIGIDDAVAAVRFLMSADGIVGAVNVTAPHPVTNAEFARAMGKALRRPAVLPAPAFALRLAMGPMADEALLASTRAVPVRLIQAGFRFAQPTVEEALVSQVSKGRRPGAPVDARKVKSEVKK